MTDLKIEFSPDALEQVRTIGNWWNANRTAAPDLFHDELAATLEMLRPVPNSASPYKHRRIQGLRRTLMQRTRYHLYFTYHEDRTLIFVHAIWHAVRGRGPRL